MAGRCNFCTLRRLRREGEACHIEYELEPKPLVVEDDGEPEVEARIRSQFAGGQNVFRLYPDGRREWCCWFGAVSEQCAC